MKLSLILGGSDKPVKDDQQLVNWQACIDGMNEAEPGQRASKATLNAGQAAVDVINARRGRT